MKSGLSGVARFAWSAMAVGYGGLGCFANVVETEVAGVAILCDERVATPQRTADIVQAFNRSLVACVDKERMVDLLSDEAILAEVHQLIGEYGGNAHVPPVDFEALDRLRDQYLQFRNESLDYRLRKIRILYYDDVLAAMQRGETFSGLTYRAEQRSIEADIRLGSDEWKREVVFPLRGPEDIQKVEALFAQLLKTLDDALEYEAKVAAVRYVYTKAEAGSKVRFDFIDDRERWFHMGYSGYVAYLVARHYIGEKETKELWERLYSFKTSQAIPEVAIFEWREQDYDRRALVWLAQRIFFEANRRIQFDGVAEFLKRINRERAQISAGEVTVKALLEDHLSCSMLELLQGTAGDSRAETITPWGAVQMGRDNAARSSGEAAGSWH